MFAAWFPETCRGCGARGVALCGSCIQQARTCEPLLVPDVDVARVLCTYSGPVRATILAAKYHRRFHALQAFVAPLVALARTFPPVDLVTAPPAADAHFAARGYDPAAQLARAVATAMRVPYARCLRRHGDTPQTGRRAGERRDGPDVVAFRTAPRLLIVDDVTTTGATLAAVARALRRTGALHVGALVVARAIPSGRGRGNRT